ncbi:MAG TPA: chorismate-binding protein, partial [Bacteroidia bacterium]
MTIQVIYRKPGETEVYVLEADGGHDVFSIYPFKSGIPVIKLSGTFKTVTIDEVKQVFNEWRFPAELPASNNSLENYVELVEKAVDEISENALKKVVLAATQDVYSSVKPIDLFFNLLDHFKDAFVYVFNTGTVSMIGASPETLLKKENKILKTEALGGTKTHGTYSEKEYLEHENIVKYLESVLVSENYEFEKGELKTRSAGRVEHLNTAFDIKSLNEEADKLLRLKLHPTSAVCGQPLNLALEFIEKYEHFDRRYYAGFLGPENSEGDFNSYVNLRCAEIYQGVYRLFAGAG